METALFFLNGDKNLFGVLHQPETNPAGIGIVMCPPFAEEKQESHRVFVNFARMLADHGFHVLRFDYYGTGDSQGDWEEATWESHLSDIRAGIQHLAAQGCREIGLFGLRLGGTLARVYAEANTGVSFLILWEPIIKVREYLYECLRANLTTQMMQRGKILKNRQVLLADLAEGTPVNVSGYLITKMYYEGCKDIDLENLDQYPAPSYVVHIRAGYRHPDTIDYMQEDEDGETSALSRFKKKYTHPKSREEVTSASYAFWNEPLKYYYTHYEELFNRSLAWLDGIRGKA